MFSRNQMNGYEKALVIGVGGGNDIVSAVLAAMYLSNIGVKSDVAGILSPAAVHTFDMQTEAVVNRIMNVRRVIPSKMPVEITFVDPRLAHLVRDMKLPFENMYDLSIRRGTAALIGGIEELVEKNSYDVVIGVDVGGDVLARGKQDPTVMSPVMDFTSLYALGQLSVDSLLIEFGLGTDGELRPFGMGEILRELRDKKVLLHEGRICKDDPEIGIFRDLYEGVARIRQGHTATMTLQTLDTETPELDIVSTYRSSYKIGGRKWLNEFAISLPHETFGRTYVFDAKRLAAERRETAMGYENPLELYIKLKRVATWKTELDLHHLWSGDSWRTAELKGNCLMFLVPPTSLAEKMRQEILEHGIDYMRGSGCDAVLMLGEDADALKKNNVDRFDSGRFSVLSVAKDAAGFSEETAELVESYQR